MARNKKHEGNTETINTNLRKDIKYILSSEYRQYKLYANDLIEFFVDVILPDIPVEVIQEYKKTGKTNFRIGNLKKQETHNSETVIKSNEVNLIETAINNEKNKEIKKKDNEIKDAMNSLINQEDGLNF